MTRKALIVWGGWDGHDPENVAGIFATDLRDSGFEVEVSHTLDAFKDVEKLKTLSLIVPVWTCGDPTPEQINPVMEAVASGVGIGGCHGGMCDAFRNQCEYQFMTGGQWVSHPGGGEVKHQIHICDHEHPITKGIKDFEVVSEQYYLHVDPAIKVLATTRFPVADGPHVPNGDVDMPAVWTKVYGKGRVFYCSLGHDAGIVGMPQVREICKRGLLWAAR